LKLPSKGEFWPPDAIDMPITGEIPVYPMTSRDEITLRTPDALMNGTSVIEVIHSCCPSIKNAWKMPSVDIDAVLIAIRIASYGTNMDVDTKCPECKVENNNQLDLSGILAGIVVPDYTTKIEIDDLKIKLKPQEFLGVNRQNLINFEEQKIMNSLANLEDEPEKKSAIISASMNKLVDLGIDIVSESTEYIELSDGTQVTDHDFISEFYKNANGSVMRRIQDVLGELNRSAAIKNQKVQCSDCSTEYQVPLNFDYANFFDQGS
jgi:hypothetical protein